MSTEAEVQGDTAAEANTTQSAEETPQSPATTPQESAPTEVAPILDGKPIEEASSEAGDKGLLSQAEEQKVEIPDEYEFTKAEDCVFDDDAIKDLSVFAKETKCTQDEAQKSFDVAHKMFDKLVHEQREADAKHREAEVEKWNKLPDSSERAILAQKAVDKHPGLMEHLQSTGLVYDSNVLHVLSEYGKLLSEGKAVTSGDAPSGGALQNPYTRSPELVD